jgi:hypothetical protein
VLSNDTANALLNRIQVVPVSSQVLQIFHETSPTESSIGVVERHYFEVLS